MARRRYLIAYDIRDPKRLRRVCKVMEAYGVRIQYSVFLCDLSGIEFARWRAEIHSQMDLGMDSVVHVNLGAVEGATTIETIGVPRLMPPSGAVIV
ncbi:CRISPR-associated endonuclease Cas2 [Prescottella subtropica]|uniref:CRISPR-associated endonuclease Cas2 n=1 Tax=Prescottella subtropica TaxID=2545757 RepID=UPI0010F8CB7B|nr:CRISPR-associated endonuclease Cas2 [Prescottella subtropica]